VKIRGPIRYVVAGTIAGAIVTGTALAHDSSDHEADTPGAVVPALEQNAAAEFVPVADGKGGIVTDARGRVALASKAGIEALLADLAAEGGMGRDPRQPDAVPTVRIADHLDRLAAERAVEFVAADDPRLLAYCSVEAVAADRCAP
jgi:hypothetical protein